MNHLLARRPVSRPRPGRRPRRLGLEPLETRRLLSLPTFYAAELVRAAGADLDVDAYSVPEIADFNPDELPDLIVGEKTSTGWGKVRVYPNTGSAAQPEYTSWSYVRAEGAELTVQASGCLGAFPRVMDFDYDGRRDLLVGLADGRVQVRINQNTNADPQFGPAAYLQVGPTGSTADADVGNRATVEVVDFDNDGRLDLLLGAYDGKLRLLLDRAAAGTPEFHQLTLLQDHAGDLLVPSGRSSPAMFDLDRDGRKDLVAGNTAGQILFYANTGTDASPEFAGYVPLQAAGVPIDLAGTPRSRPWLGDYNADGVPDLLVGAADGLVRLYAGGDLVSPEVVGRHVFYNDSSFDGRNPDANRQDDQAIAPDKQALLPGQTATFANYTGYSRGINGVMIDVADLLASNVLFDLRFAVGNDDHPEGWAAAADPAGVTLRPGAGSGGSDRLTITWPDNAIHKQWLQVNLLLEGHHGWTQTDVFYFGNAIGETGNSATDTKVNAIDMLAARDNPRNFLDPAPIDFPYDFDRDARVSATDMLIARNNQTHFLNALRLITVPGGKPKPAGIPAMPWGDSAWLHDFQPHRPSTGAASAEAGPQPADALLFPPGRS